MSETKGSVLFFELGDETTASLEERFSNAGLEVFKPEAPEAAFDVLKNEKPGIVLTEYSPKAADVVEFLKQVREQYPSTCRAVLCDESDQMKMINLLIKGIVTCYFEKDEAMVLLVKALRHFLDVRNILKSRRLLKLVNTIDRLPTFPTIYQEFMQGIEADSSLKEIAAIIEKDISLSSKALQIANSAFYGSGKMASVQRACVYLGMGTIKNVVFMASVSSAKKLSGKEVHYLERIVRHSLKTNQHFQRFYKSDTGKKAPEEFASIGLTHDIGKIIMLQYLPDRFKKIIKYQQKNPDIGFYRSEIELGFEGCTHCEIGAYFLELWNFPESNVTTALFHHAPEQAAENYRQLLETFDVADKFARQV